MHICFNLPQWVTVLHSLTCFPNDLLRKKLESSLTMMNRQPTLWRIFLLYLQYAYLSTFWLLYIQDVIICKCMYRMKMQVPHCQTHDRVWRSYITVTSFTRRHFNGPPSVTLCHCSVLTGDGQSWEAVRQTRLEWNSCISLHSSSNYYKFNQYYFIKKVCSIYLLHHTTSFSWDTCVMWSIMYLLKTPINISCVNMTWFLFSIIIIGLT